MTSRLGVLCTFANGPRSVGNVLAATAPHGLPVIVDSGAFSVLNGAASIDVDDHARFVCDTAPDHPHARFVALDVIGDPEATWTNWTTERDAGAPVEPTIHLGTNPAEVDRYLKAGLATGWVNLGGMVGSSDFPRLVAWAAAVMVRCPPDTKFHGLGCTHPVPNRQIGFDSIDSTYWLSPTMPHRSLPLFDPARGNWRLISTATTNPDGRAKGWAAAYGDRPFLATYGTTPDQVTGGDSAALIRLSIASHAKYVTWLRERHGRDLVCFLAGAAQTLFPTIAAIDAREPHLEGHPE